MLKFIKLIVLNLLLIACSYADNSLAAFQAFQVKVESQNQNYMWVKFTIAQDYHLYQNKIKLIALDDSSVKLGKPVFPDPLIIATPESNSVSIYEKQLDIQLPISNYGNGNLHIKINYQGCKGTTLCLPEQQLIESINLTTGTILSDADTNQTQPSNELLSSSATTTQIANYFGQSSIWVIISFFALGLLIAFTPCVFPLLPILITVIAGKNISAKRSFILAFSYILGGGVIYALAGVLAASLGHSVSAWFQTWWVSAILALLFTLFALSLFGLFEIRLPHVIQQKLNNSVSSAKGGSIIGSFIIGGLSNLILSPCVTAPLAGALVYISTTGNQLLGGLALFALGFGSGIPLLIIAVFGKKLLPKTGSWMQITKQVLGLIMLGMTAYMISKIISGFDDLIVIIWISISLIILGTNIKRLKNPKIAKLGVGFVLILAIGSYKYTSLQKEQLVHDNFINVTSTTELDQQLAIAKSQKQAVILDFYANWCSACKEMDLRTFSNQTIQEKFNKYRMIRIDVTHNTSDIKAIQNRFGIFALPSLIMLNQDGTIAKDLQTYGFVNSSELLSKLAQFEHEQQNICNLDNRKC